MTLCLGKSFVDQGLSKSTCVSIYNIECLINQVEFSKSFLYCQHMISWRQSWIENGHDPGAETGTLPSSSTDPKGWNVQGQLPATDEASRIPELVSFVPISEKKINENISTCKLQINLALFDGIFFFTQPFVTELNTVDLTSVVICPKLNNMTIFYEYSVDTQTSPINPLANTNHHSTSTIIYHQLQHLAKCSRPIIRPLHNPYSS